MKNISPTIAIMSRSVVLLNFDSYLLRGGNAGFFVAKVLHPTGMQPAMAFFGLVRMENCLNPLHPGAMISARWCEPSHGNSLKKNVQSVDVVSTRMPSAHGL